MLGTHLRLVPGLGNGRVQLVDAEQLQGVGGGQLRVHLQQWLAQVSGGQDQARLGVGDDRQQAFLVMAARRFRRVGRHRDDPAYRQPKNAAT